MNKTEQSSILSLRSYSTKRVVMVKNLGLFGLFKFNLIPSHISHISMAMAMAWKGLNMYLSFRSVLSCRVFPTL